MNRERSRFDWRYVIVALAAFVGFWLFGPGPTPSG